jgi:hypothetical protein
MVLDQGIASQDHAPTVAVLLIERGIALGPETTLGMHEEQLPRQPAVLRGLTHALFMPMSERQNGFFVSVSVARAPGGVRTVAGAPGGTGVIGARLPDFGVGIFLIDSGAFPAGLVPVPFAGAAPGAAIAPP